MFQQPSEWKTLSESHTVITSAREVKTSDNVTSNSPSQDYTHPGDHSMPSHQKIPAFTQSINN